ncbi:tetratricopeptide repeat protein [Halostreptopolyspora alba]|uniref:Tetratricopeptide repeat protein n=1 Tax=Halostreptopolyspora alba TaxID=2487137 RepID=A0A3N0E1J4_9ACTN|nr:tetratricopeptide repeat protein [Nocardiopsaceae bacterium YIM 96095]
MTTLTPEAVEPAATALLDTMVPLTLAADRRINPGRWVLSPLYATVDDTVFEDRSHAIEWMNTHAGTVRGCVRIAHETGHYETAWTLCEGLWAWLHISKNWRLWRTTHEIGLEAAERCDITAQARMLSALGALHLWTDNLDEAERLHQRARSLWVSAVHALGQATSLENLGIIALKQGTPIAAREYFRQARTMFSDLGVERGVVLMERRIGESYRDSGDYDQAETNLRSALGWFLDSGDDYQVIRTRRSLALTLQGQQRDEAARELLEEARRLAETIGATTDAEEFSRLADQVRS